MGGSRCSHVYCILLRVSGGGGVGVGGGAASMRGCEAWSTNGPGEYWVRTVNISPRNIIEGCSGEGTSNSRVRATRVIKQRDWHSRGEGNNSPSGQ
ncbi:hypothetical protein Pcinc_044390 [Petrolisthes cinctipes]|uniref:Uncharacterized protein n=1 Tax=Petrolisthes cinctipes TaxID=88211 RepID=A0AAE1BES6_PETCI|nr:hypothetical protein Pcinc_044390 [Petrolisthes cinctipes]